MKDSIAKELSPSRSFVPTSSFVPFRLLVLVLTVSPGVTRRDRTDLRAKHETYTLPITR